MKRTKKIIESTPVFQSLVFDAQAWRHCDSSSEKGEANAVCFLWDQFLLKNGRGP
ncbi:hypothetical protein SAMN05444274_104390 [Mariniphaga anaerophila]|uniref:Uncharacterized protein n=1 Tax=Mariniphaga anaerophila TaxID=1484053 RepID=A0A1M5AMY0_9BACT|nr:hypothetical protein [Mariniphaga anaerophila]SHF31282.1 hypothetical protein SAMN05444274_104390 [Mariniphaga anaerophila]